MHLQQLVDGDKVAEIDAKKKAKELSIMARQRAKDLAMFGESNFASPTKSPSKRNKFSKSLTIPSSAITSRRLSLSLTDVTVGGAKDDALVKVQDAISKVQSSLREVKDKIEINLELAKERYLAKDPKASAASNKIGKLMI